MFDHILVDEYQDTNALQADILEGMRPADGPRNLTVVGDDAQAIYGFRAATVKNILEFPERFPGATIDQARTELPVDAADPGGVERGDRAQPAAAREDPSTDADRASSRPIAPGMPRRSRAERRRLPGGPAHREEGVPLKAQAVLFRAAHHSDHLEVELARRNIPFVKYGGLKFMEAAHVKDALACLRILENPFDEVSWFRVLQLLDGMGPASARRLMDELEVRRGDAADADVAARAVPRGAGRGAEGRGARHPRPPQRRSATASTPTRSRPPASSRGCGRSSSP